MVSQVDPTFPQTGAALTANVRQNFQFTKDEIEALQAAQLGAALAARIDAHLGSNAWQTTLTDSQVVAAVDTILGSTDWQSGSGAQIVSAIDTQLGQTTWQTGGGLTGAALIAEIDATLGASDWQLGNAASIIGEINGALGGTEWQSQILPAQIITAINGLLGSSDWQIGAGAAIVASIDAQLGSTTWQGGAGTGTLDGWQTWSPAWTALTLDPVLGNGTLVGRYLEVGNIIHVWLYLEAGSTTVFGVGPWEFNLPFDIDPAMHLGLSNTIPGFLYVNRGGHLTGLVRPLSTAGIVRLGVHQDGQDDLANLDSTIPAGWTTGDRLSFMFSYEHVGGTGGGFGGAGLTGGALVAEIDAATGDSNWRDNFLQTVLPSGILGLSALQPLFIDDALGQVFPANSGNVIHANSIIGISLNAAPNINDPVTIMRHGALQDPSFSFNTSINPQVFLNGLGVLSQTPPVAPSSLFNLQVGFAVSTDTLLVDIQRPIFLSP